MGKNPLVTQLDSPQIIKRVYDESNDRIRVDANITAPNGAAIIIDDVDDSIKIGNGNGKYATITPIASHNAIDVNVVQQTNNPSGFINVVSNYPKQVSVGTVSVSILPQNLNRIYAHIINNTNTPAYIQYGIAAQISQGIPLRPGCMLTLNGFDLWLGEVFCIALSDSINIDVMDCNN